MKAITFLLHTQQPLLATSFQGDPNSDVSYSYIPGSMIRGVMIGRYMKHHKLSELDLENEQVQHLFFDCNKIKYLNAYLLSRKNKRTLPILRCWFKEKNDELSNESLNTRQITAYDFSIKKKLSLEAPKFVGEGFWTQEGERVISYKEQRRINIHNRRDRTKGRSSKTGEGEIFRYDAIDAEQTFQAVIVCEEIDPHLIELLQKSSDLWLGGSQSAGYGHTKIADITPHDNWNEVDSPDKRTEHEDFTITLLSDLIMRDECGQYAVIPPSSQQVSAPIVKLLEAKLGIKLQPKISFASSTLIGGFNRKWGLPLPQVSGLAAGSVFVFNYIDITSRQIQKLESEGLGERIIDGFGRIAINLREYKNFTFALPNKKEIDNQPPFKQKLSRDIAERMIQKLIQQKLESKLQSHLTYLEIKGKIYNSQLSRLRLVARRALPTGDCNLVISLLNNLPSNAKGQFESAKVGHNSLKKTLTDWLEKPTSCIINPQDVTVRIGDIERKLNDELAQKYTLRLIMALAKKAMKENK